MTQPRFELTPERAAIIAEGAQARADGKTKADNPYPVIGLRWRLWNTGYSERPR